ncbi:MAG: nucleotide exchange factor GrpE [Flavobacteriia bacterium]|nr:nucleotide exchange factor GrpE [Flavobacteriia bacterium]OJX34984.1 MAG: nucleotide exchange factor GrpE [Flavobacteriia bacterium 40-80]
MKEDIEDNIPEEGAENTAGQNGSETENEVNQEQDNNSSVEEQLKELNDRYVRLYSEFDNYRKRTNKEKIDIISSANAGLLKDLIPTLDDFERAIANNQQTEDIEALKEGFLLIFNKFKAVLESKGLKQMEAKGQPFDSEIHEAIANIPAPAPELAGCVVDDVEKGYYLNDKVIRYAKVVVGQ